MRLLEEIKDTGDAIWQLTKMIELIIAAKQDKIGEVDLDALYAFVEQLSKSDPPPSS